MIRQQPGVAYSLTIRAEYENNPGMLGEITSAIGNADGSIDAFVDPGYTFTHGRRGRRRERPGVHSRRAQWTVIFDFFFPTSKRFRAPLHRKMRGGLVAETRGDFEGAL